MNDRIDRTEVCSQSAVRRVAAMLDLDPDAYRAGEPLPVGWQFFMLGGDTRRSSLREDGFPGFGVPMPALGLPRLLIAGRSVLYHRAIPISSVVARSSAVESIQRKTTANGPMAIVTLRHELRVTSEQSPSVVETQTFVLMNAGPKSQRAPVPSKASDARFRRTLTPDDTLLFQYSALGFNSHKIHIDRAYARDVEGLPDLVVNGGLTTLLLTEFLRAEAGISPASLKAQYSAPLYCNRPMTLMAEQVGDRWNLKALDENGIVAASLEVATS